MGKKEDISAAITPALEALGFYLEDVTITSAGRRSMLTIIVDISSFFPIFSFFDIKLWI